MMLRTRLGLLALCAVLLGLMVFSAGPAHAETGAKWLILNSKGELKTGSELKASFATELEDAHGALLVPDILGRHFTLLCTASALIGAFLEGNGSFLSGLKAIYTGCKVLLNGTLSESCEPHSIGSPVGTVQTNELKGLIVLVGGAARVRVESKGGGEEPLANISMGEECPIGENLPVRGKLFIEDKALATHSVTHLSTEDVVNTDLWVLNKVVAHKVTISGSTNTFLVGAHKDLKWSGDSA